MNQVQDQRTFGDGDCLRLLTVNQAMLLKSMHERENEPMDISGASDEQKADWYKLHHISLVGFLDGEDEHVILTNIGMHVAMWIGAVPESSVLVQYAVIQNREGL